MRALLRKSKEKLNNEKGAAPIEIILGVIVMLVVLSFLIDIFTINWQASEVSSIADTYAKVASAQGGIQADQPAGWAGLKSYYTSPRKAYEAISPIMNNAKISDWILKINDEIVATHTGPTAGTKLYDYRSPMSVSIEFKIGFSVTKNFIPGVSDFKIQSIRSVLSEYKTRYDGLDRTLE